MMSLAERYYSDGEIVGEARGEARGVIKGVNELADLIRSGYSLEEALKRINIPEKETEVNVTDIN